MAEKTKTNFNTRKLIKFFVFFAALAGTILLLKSNSEALNFYNSWQLFVTTLSICFSFFTLGYYLVIAFLAYCYKPAAVRSDDELPTCTVIVPAYNEGRQVLSTVESLLNCDFPKEKMEIIVVDDGSKDDTRHWILQAQKLDNSIVKTILLDKNKGKKHALYQAIKQAANDILVTVDSDSMVEPDAVRNLMGHFCNDSKVGAVAGNIRIKNMEDGAIPKMLDVAFAFGFEFMRCAQSFIGTVLCTPGALSAYRKSAVLPVLDTWLNQTFMGLPSTIGEDRAITSLLIRTGHKTLYQNNAFAFTEIPSTYKRTCRMLVRWTRSDIRENIAMTKYAFSDIKKWDMLRMGLQLNLIFFDLGMLLPLIFFPTFILFILTHLGNIHYIAAGTAVVSCIWAILPALIYADRYSVKKSLWAFAYAVFGAFFLSWIPGYSLLTVKNSDWMTRELSQQGREEEFCKTSPTVTAE